jgi:dipeptidyl aminopeptidase/acylaminoacyl peptidase
LYEDEGISFAGFSFDPDIIYVGREHEGRVALFEYSISSKSLGKLVFSHPEHDVYTPVFDMKRRELIGVAYSGVGPEMHYLDEQAEREAASIGRALPKTTNRIFSISDDRNRAIIKRSSDVHPPEYYLFLRDTKPKRIDFLLTPYPELVELRFAPMRPISYRARDGLVIPGYITLPLGRAAKKLPLIVYPHGGPTARDVRGFDPVVHLFASRGFAVFQPNFRGSSGYGSDFIKKGHREWGLAMQDDITDGVQWLIEQGIADPDRIGIYGASYGGYAALMGLAKTPELYRAGASYAGVTSLPQLLADDAFYRFDDFNRPTVGGEWGDGGRLKQNSPLHRVDDIQVPVLLGHGVDDPRVHVKHSDRMASALRSAGKSVEYLKFEDEAHGFLLESNRLAFYRRLIGFFEEHLAPKAPAH